MFVLQKKHHQQLLTAHFSYLSSLRSIQEILPVELELNMTFLIVTLTKLSTSRERQQIRLILFVVVTKT